MNNKTKSMVGVGLFTAIVVVLQFLGGGIKFGMFSISLVLVPIVVGSAIYGGKAGAWLGFAFGAAVLLSGDAAAFLVINPLATGLVVLVKGIGCGLGAGILYRLLEKLNITQPTLSHHMKILCDAEIVNGRKVGKWTYYSLNCDNIMMLREIMQVSLSDACIPEDCDCVE